LFNIVKYGLIWYKIGNMPKIKELRLSKLLSQAKLARLSGVSRTTIVAIENSQHEPQDLTLHKLAKALEVDPKEIEYDNRTQ